MPISSFPASGLLLSGVETLMEVGAFRNCCWYAFAAVTPELLLPPLEDSPPLPLPLLVLLLLLHAAMASADVSITTVARVFLIRASPWHALGAPRT